MDRPYTLPELGWSDWFERRAHCGPTDTVARVTVVDREQLLLVDSTGHFRARLAGRYLHRHRQPDQLPCVGDWVCVERRSGEDFGVIHALVQRRTSLRRKSAGNTIDHQMIAANLDQVLIVQSCLFDFNLNRLERYLVMAMESGAEPCILLTKTDLADPAVLAAQVAEIESAAIGVPILPLSGVTGDGLDDLRKRLLPGKTYCFVGSSGVGKSTLINLLIGQQRLEVGAVSGTGEGRHTTVRRQLIVVEGGALVIDNPGMRELGIVGAERGLEGSHSAIAGLSSSCRYRDCTHTGEPGCAVRAAVQAGALSPESLDNFLKLREESGFNDLSYAEKRKKDRDFGRYIKTVKKDSRER